MIAPTPDRSFMNQLKSLDKALGIKFNGEHFVITFKIDGGPTVNIWRVVAGDGGFRQPDQRDLEMLQQSRIDREGPEERQQRVARYMTDIRARDRQKAKENIRGMTRDNIIQLYHHFEVLNGGTWSSPGTYHNPAFRRIAGK